MKILRVSMLGAFTAGGIYAALLALAPVASIQEAIDVCPPEGCVIQVEEVEFEGCGPHIVIDGKQNIVIEGAGMNAAIRNLFRQEDCGTRSYNWLLEIRNSRWITIRDIRLDSRSICTLLEECTTSPGVVLIRDSRDITFIDTHNHSMHARGGRRAIGLHTVGNVSNVTIRGGRNHSSGWAAWLKNCDACLIDGGWFSPMNGTLGLDWSCSEGGIGLVKQQGQGFRVVGTLFELPDMDAGGSNCIRADGQGQKWAAIRLIGDDNDPTDGPPNSPTDPNSGAGIWSNQIWVHEQSLGVDHVYGWGLFGLYAYENASVVGNMFIIDGPPQQVTGIMLKDTPACVGCNRNNLIALNQFKGFETKPVGFEHCPIVIRDEVDTVFANNLGDICQAQ